MGDEAAGRDVRCPKCGQFNEPERETCWACAALMSGAGPAAHPAPPPALAPQGVGPAALLVLAALVPVAVMWLKFGTRFLIQFFVSPLQFFIVPPLAIAVFALKNGVMPTRRSGPILRGSDPVSFWMFVGFNLLAGTAFFVFNLWISYNVVTRPGKP